MRGKYNPSKIYQCWSSNIRQQASIFHNDKEHEQFLEKPLNQIQSTALVKKSNKDTVLIPPFVGR